MNNTCKLAIIAIAMVFTFTSCASSKKNLSAIPAAPSATTVPVAEKTPETKSVENVPAATSASTSTSTTKKVVAISTPPVIPSKEKSLKERIDEASETITLTQAQEILTALSDPANDPDGKLTQMAIAKTQVIAKKLIDTAMTEEQIGYYLDLLGQAKDAYGPLLEQDEVSIQSYIDLANERLCCIQAYAKNSIYSYLKKYPKGHYTKELARMLSQKAGK